MNSSKIFVYTGTGNCLASAKKMSERLGAEIVFITAELVESESVFEGGCGIIIFPTYGYGMPKTVRRFVQKCGFRFEYFAVCTSIGSVHGGALAEAIRLLKKRGQRVDYSAGIKSVENYVHMFGFASDEKIKERNEQQSQKTEQIIGDILAKKCNKRLLFRPFSSFVAFIFRLASRIFAKRYKFLDTCNGCTICQKVCPAAAIKIDESKKPSVTAKKCDHCQACLQLCPNRAIKFGKIKPNTKRYHHTEITLPDLIKR